MYGYLRKRLPRPVAIFLTGFVYGLILFAIYLCSFAPPAEFRYMEL